MDLVQPSLRHLGVELVDLQWRPGRGGVLRVTIDSSSGVTLGDCERVSNAIGTVLDAHDAIDSRYHLEVTSPGAERPVRTEEEWRAALGRRINVRAANGDAETVVEGRLTRVEPEVIELEARDRNRRRLVEVARQGVIAARVVVDI